MSRIPDYDKMRHKLAVANVENYGGDDLYDIMIHGYIGLEHMSNEDVLDTFVNMFDVKDIPKIETKQEQCEKCTYVVCVCKPVPFYTPNKEK